MVEHLQAGYLGELREVYAFCLTGHLADPATPLGWWQNAALSGLNTLALGMLQETLLRWVPPCARVLSQVHAFIPTRTDPQSGLLCRVGAPDSVQVLAVLTNGARAVLQLSGVTPFGHGAGIWLYGSDGVLHYDLTANRIRGASRHSGTASVAAEALTEMPIPEAKARTWQVEADFVAAIRTGAPIRFTDFASGVAYMEFTEAVARSADQGKSIELPSGEP